MIIEDKLFYKRVRPIVSFLIKVLFNPKVEGLENIPEDGRILLAGNHTRWLDPVTLVGIQKRQIHFLAKEELFHGITKFIVNGMGCVPVNRKIHDKNALKGAIDFLNKDLCVGIFPEGTINRSNDTIMPFKIGAVKACFEANSKLVPFIITGNYNIFKRNLKIEFLKPISISEDLTKENERFMKIVREKLEESENDKKRKNANL